MSAKWRRSLAWDDQHFPKWAWPAKAVLRAFSSITLAVALLTFVSVYGALASVPIGLIALIPSYAVYALALVATAGVLAALAGATTHLLAQRLATFPRRVLVVAIGTGAALYGAYLWFNVPAFFTWPALAYDTAHHTGLRFFPEFVERYKETTLRRLPGFEMTELEFYSWWPLRVVLALFVANMIIATVRRIEFNFKNIGVLTVHTGIIIIAVGSIYYAQLKREGDLYLSSGSPDAQTGLPTEGRAVGHFFDINAIALHLSQPPLFEQRPIRLPRYNAYGLDAGAEGKTAWTAAGRRVVPADGSEPRALDRPVPDMRGSLIDDDLEFRIVGYAPYAELRTDYVPIDPALMGPLETPNPLRVVHLLQYAADETPSESDRPAFAFWFLPEDPAHRVSETSVFAVEYARPMPPARRAALEAFIPKGSFAGLAVSVPGAGVAETIAVAPGSVHEIAGYTIEVQQILPEPPFPIVTEGYRGTSSSVAIVRVVSPDGETYDRYIYHRYPELNQDILQDENLPDGRPARRNADPKIDIVFLDDSKLQIYFDERPDGGVDAIVRRPGRAPVITRLDSDRLPDFVPDEDPNAPRLDLLIAERWEHARPFERPVPVPQQDQDGDLIGTHRQSFTAVEVIARSIQTPNGPWRRTVWTPFNPFAGDDPERARTIDLPDGRSVTVAVGPVRHSFRDFRVSLIDFQMLAYDHRGAPRDYQSTLRVTPKRVPTPEGLSNPGFEPYTHIAKLNAPLRAPFLMSDERPPLLNVLGLLAGGFNPHQYKLSQAGWDQQGWLETQAAADRGELPRPFARFTILRVGNNPGIYVVALGSILVGIGTPWAFYVKPWLVRRERDRLRRAAELGEAKPVRADAPRPKVRPTADPVHTSGSPS